MQRDLHRSARPIPVVVDRCERVGVRTPAGPGRATGAGPGYTEYQLLSKTCTGGGVVTTVGWTAMGNVGISVGGIVCRSPAEDVDRPAPACTWRPGHRAGTPPCRPATHRDISRRT